jgi:hypothetical protein
MVTAATATTILNGTSVVLRVPRRAKRRRVAPKGPERLHAHAVSRILDRETGELVGWLYEWNTGEVVPRWIDKAKSDVVYD